MKRTILSLAATLLVVLSSSIYAEAARKSTSSAELDACVSNNRDRYATEQVTMEIGYDDMFQEIYVTFDNSVGRQIVTLTNETGQIVYRQLLDTSSDDIMIIDASTLSSGHYMLKLVERGNPKNFAVSEFSI